MMYVVGFLFDDSAHRVVMIRKKRPEWQAGKLNGVGGKIEKGEWADTAMIREFREEAGVQVPNWHQFIRLQYREADLFFYAAKSSSLFEQARTMEDEEIEHVGVDFALGNMRTQFADPNLEWLIPMARYAVRDRIVYSGTHKVRPIE